MIDSAPCQTTVAVTEVILIGDTHPDDLGLLMDIFLEDDPSPAKAQVAARYAHGGGWRPMKGFSLKKEKGAFVLHYPGDDLFMPRAVWRLHDEVIVLYQYGVVGIFQPDGSFEVTRMD